MSDQTVDGIKWIEERVYSIADELGIKLDSPPEWDEEDLNLKMAVEVRGQRKILMLWRPNIDDSQGGNNPPTREVQKKLHDQLFEFLQSFEAPVPPKRRIGF
jgi:hypothetical protein